MPKKTKRITCEIVRKSGLWPRTPVLTKAANAVVGQIEKMADGFVTFVFTDDAEIQVLNHDWRGKDNPTNVLSFPDGDEDDTGHVHLGDVILAHQTLTREAKELDISFKDHLSHLMLHGCLHLLGYDHITHREAKEMEGLETKLLARMGINNPYKTPAD